MLEFALHFFEAKDTPVDIEFLLIHQLIDLLERLHLCINIGHKGYVFVIFMDSQAENSILSLIGVLIRKKLLLRVRIDPVYLLPNGSRKNNSGY
jgi:hypothetical protein